MYVCYNTHALAKYLCKSDIIYLSLYFFNSCQDIVFYGQGDDCTENEVKFKKA